MSRRAAPVLAVLLVAALAGGCVEVPTSAGREPPRYAGAASPASDRLIASADAASRRAALLAGRLAEARGHWEEAEAQYALVWASDPSDEEAIMSRARALHALGRGNEAALLLHDAVARDPGSVPLLRAAGASVLALGSPSMASEYYRHALDRAPGDPLVRGDYAWALHLDGRHDAVLVVLAGVAEDGLPAHARLALGRAALLQGDASAAARHLAAWLVDAPDDTGARLDLARAQFLARQDAEVLRSLDAVLSRRPEDAQAYALLGHVRERAGQHELALRSYEEAVRRGADRLALGPLIDRARAALSAGGPDASR